MHEENNCGTGKPFIFKFSFSLTSNAPPPPPPPPRLQFVSSIAKHDTENLGQNMETKCATSTFCKSFFT